MEGPYDADKDNDLDGTGSLLDAEATLSGGERMAPPAAALENVTSSSRSSCTEAECSQAITDQNEDFSNVNITANANEQKDEKYSDHDQQMEEIKPREKISLLAEMDVSLESNTSPTQSLINSGYPNTSRLSGPLESEERQLISPTSRNHRQTNEEGESDNDELLMMIAKKRAALGAEQEGCESLEEKALNGRVDKAKGSQRPGAYATAPGGPPQRVGTFQKAEYIMQAIKNYNSKPLQQSSSNSKPAAAATASDANKEGKPRRSRKSRKERISMKNEGTNTKQEPDLDRKPAARKTRPTATTNEQKATNDRTRRFMMMQQAKYPSKMQNTSMAAVASFRRNLTRSSHSDEASFRRNNTNQTRSSGSSDCPSFASSRRNNTFGSSTNSERSARLSWLAQSICNVNSFAMDGSGDCLERSQQEEEMMIVNLAEQSVNNFVKTCQKIEALPIAATVVPSEEELETLIRSRLESELRTHLSHELQNFRQNLFQEIMLRNQVQVADPVLEEGGARTEYIDGGSLSLSLFHLSNEEQEDESSNNDRSNPGIMNAPITRPAERVQSFADDIRQSIHLELSHLEDDIELAQVIPSNRSFAHDMTVERSCSSTEEGSSSEYSARHGIARKARDGEFVFSTKGLMVCALMLFFIGALAGAVGAIVTCQAIS